MELEIINKLFLQLSQITTAQTSRELALAEENQKLRIGRLAEMASILSANPIKEAGPGTNRIVFRDSVPSGKPGYWCKHMIDDNKILITDHEHLETNYRRCYVDATWTCCPICGAPRPDAAARAAGVKP